METYRIIYASTAARPFGAAEFDRLLLQARIYNYSESIGGLLLRAGLQFLEVLEGPAPAVEDLYARIAADPRHRAVRTLEAAAVGGLVFPQLVLGFADVEPAALSRLIAAFEPLPHTSDEPAAVAELLLEFVEEHCPQVLGPPGNSVAGRLHRSQYV